MKKTKTQTTEVTPQAQNISLFYREGSSDKVYLASLEEKSGGWVVNFSFGRRGSTLQSGTKTSSPVPFDKAKGIYDKIVGEKMAKGYTQAEGGKPYVSSENAGRVSGLLPQLLNMVDDEELARLINNTTHCAQEKFDGRRTLVRKNSIVEGTNKKGLIIPLPQPIQAALEAFDGAFVIDGEAIGDTLYAFDLLELDGDDLRGLPYKERYSALMNLVAKSPVSGGAVVLVKTAWNPKEKSRFQEELKKKNAEGIVFKDASAAFKAGRPSSGGSQLKYKFTSTASVLVTKVNAQRSVAMALFDGGKQVDVGNVTIPANQPIPQVGQVIETRYLYAHKGGSLYQPVCLGIRDDVEPSECLLTQLKYKTEGGEEEG
jgi:bifunctional non-homologous end joining protein LigD